MCISICSIDMYTWRNLVCLCMHTCNQCPSCQQIASQLWGHTQLQALWGNGFMYRTTEIIVQWCCDCNYPRDGGWAAGLKAMLSIGCHLFVKYWPYYMFEVVLWPSPQRWSGTFPQYFDTNPGALAKILASTSNCLGVYRHSCISYLLGPWMHSVSDGIE